jgi:hypothetical protein
MDGSAVGDCTFSPVDSIDAQVQVDVRGTEIDFVYHRVLVEWRPSPATGRQRLRPGSTPHAGKRQFILQQSTTSKSDVL